MLHVPCTRWRKSNLKELKNEGPLKSQRAFVVKRGCWKLFRVVDVQQNVTVRDSLADLGVDA